MAKTVAPRKGGAASKPAARKSPAKAAAPGGSKAKPAPVPEGFHTVTPSVVVSGGEAALAHYEKALGAKVLHKVVAPGTDRIMHACLQIGSSRLFLYDEMPGGHVKAPKDGVGGSCFYLYVPDADAAHAQAVSAGMTETMAPTDAFWGDRIGSAVCRFGHHWTFATCVRSVTPEEIAEGAKAMMGQG